MFGTAGEYFHPNKRLNLFRTPYQCVRRCHIAAKYDVTWFRADGDCCALGTGRQGPVAQTIISIPRIR